MVAKGDKMFTKDIEKAYYFLRMESRAHKYMCFYDENQGYMSGLVLLFGLSQAVMFFTKVCRPTLAFLRSLGFKIMNMIDDWLVSESPSTIREAYELVSLVLTSLGWKFNDKGEEPSFIVTFLGLLVDATMHEFRAPRDKIERARVTIEMVMSKALGREPVQVQDLRRLTGQVISMTLAMPLVRCWTRSLYKEIAKADWAGATLVVLDQDALDELSFLPVIMDNHNGARIKDLSKPDLDLYADAGESGFGMHTLTREFHGPFPEHLIGTSSTRRELEGVLAGLVMIDSDEVITLPGRVLLHLDSFCAVRNLV